MKKKIKECTNEELLRNHSQLVDIEYEICGAYGEATRINLLNANDEILNREIEIKCLEKKLMNDVNFYNGEYFEYHGTHNGVDYWIASRGSHPLAYVKAAQIDFRDKANFDEFECHGEITFKGTKTLCGAISLVIGWDYAHFGLNDYSTLYEILPDFDLLKLKRWTFNEVEKEIFDFIDKYGILKEA